MFKHFKCSGASQKRALCLAASALLALWLLPLAAFAVNPAPQQTYYVSLPEDDLLQLFDDNDAAGGDFPDPVSPIRSITSISIGSTGTLVYYDQWEDGSYDADIANPGANTYANPGNLDGTQIWGDGILANGCPPSIDNVPNQCLVAADDQLQAGDVIILDNDVIVAGSSPGPYSRNPAQIFFDGRDKFGVVYPVTVTRAAFPLSPGSVMAGGAEVLDAGRWGISYRAPVGENLPAGSTSAFQDVRWFIMAGTGGATISVDANGDGDYGDANDLNGVALIEGQKRAVNGILVNATLAATGAGKVQVNSMTADVDDTFEFRWDALLPRPVWSNDYYSPVGTALKANNSGCTEVWIHNPNNAAITVNITRPGPVNATRTVPANSTVEWPAAATGLYNEGFRMFTTGTPAPVFLPIQIVDCTKDTSTTDGRLYDWGTPLFPAGDLTSQLLVPWAPGCSNESFLGVCRDAGSQGSTTRDVTTDGGRSVVWVTPLANTTIYVDKNGSGVNCQASPPTGAEQTINASALVSYRLNDNPTSRAYVRHGFGSGNYTGTDNIGQGWTQTSSAWATNWIETGDEGTSGAGAFQVVTNELRIGATGSANETGWTIRRGANLSGQTYANLRFQLRDGPSSLAATDRLAVEVTSDGTTWFRLGTFRGDQIGSAFDPISATAFYNISPYISANTAIRFVILNNMTGTNYWFVDNVHIDYAVGGTWDMTGARLVSCDGVKIAGAYGQDPQLSGSNDEEALDLGTGIAPFGSALIIQKSVNDNLVDPGTTVTYTYQVTNTGTVGLINVTVTDNKCYPATSTITGVLDPGQSRTFTCLTPIFVNTDNVAYAEGDPEGGGPRVRSAPDEARVEVTSIVGDYVWLDANGDGVQDAGESGIPNVRVTLTGTDRDGNPVSLNTVTDATGRYLFSGVPPSNASGYTVTVNTATLPGGGTGLTQTYDENGTGTPNTSNTGVLGTQDSHLTADFGYKYGNGVVGAIGDRVWIDADGDGIQDPNEMGYQGATVKLTGAGPDQTFGTADDIIQTTITGPGGNYLFSGLAAGFYNVEVTVPPPGGYTQTGDPDGTLDNKTTWAYQLAAGENQLNIDFGYQPGAGQGWTIGDEVFLDSNGDGNRDAGEPGIPGVTVALIKDTNGDGAWDPDGPDNVPGTADDEPIIATTATNGTGLYSFPGVPNGNYLVWANDTNDVLRNLTQSSAPGVEDGQPCGTCNGFSGAIAISGANNLVQDFGYKPTGQDSGEGVIGDTIFLDANGNYAPNAGEGIQGVIVELYIDPDGDGIYNQLYRTTITDANGLYSFGGLPLDPPGTGTQYQVRVNTSSLPSGGAGLTNTYDPDVPEAPPHTGNSQSVVPVLTVGSPINLNQDFGYRGTNAAQISGTVWEDINADGTLNTGDEQSLGFAGVTVVLRDEAGNIVGQTTTDSVGDFSFLGLSPGTYTVAVTDEAGVLRDYVKSNGPNPGSNNNSQVDPYTVTVVAGGTNSTADFGYYDEIPTLVVVTDVRAYLDDVGQAVVEWRTGSQTGTVGFHLERQDPASGTFDRLNAALLPAELYAPRGATYRYVDDTAIAGESYTYRLVEEEYRGGEQVYGPYQLTVQASDAEGPAGAMAPAIAARGAILPDALVARTSARFQREAHGASFQELERIAKAAGAVEQGTPAAGGFAALRVTPTAAAAVQPVTAAKMTVRQDGLYQVTAADVAAVFGVSNAQARQLIRRNQLQVSHLGQGVAAELASDGSALWFFGQSIKRVDTPDEVYSLYTDDNVYWLTRATGVRMGTLNGRNPRAGAIGHFTETLVIEEDRIPFTIWSNDPDYPDGDYWYWKVIQPPGLAEQAITATVADVAAVSGDATASLRASLRGYTSVGHLAKVSVNGSEIGQASWGGAVRHDASLPFDQVTLNSGDNTIEVEGGSLFLIDGFDLTYERQCRARNGVLIARGCRDIAGFSGRDIRLYDVTNPLQPRRVTGTRVTGTGANGYQVSFVPASPTARYLAVSGAATLSPLTLVADTPSNLKERSNRADHLIIVPAGGAFVQAAQALADYRSDQGLTSRVVTFEDICDEFTGGIRTPEAVRRFLAYVGEQWSQAPRYVVFGATGHLDYRGLLGPDGLPDTGDEDQAVPNPLPPLMASTPYGLYACESCFGDEDGDGVPRAALGRLPAYTSEELSAMIAKIKGYESASPSGAWQAQVKLVADNPDRGGNFPADSAALKALIPQDPGEYQVEEIYLPSAPAAPPALRARLLSVFGSSGGARNVSYIGHGTSTQWAAEGLLKTSDVAAMSNADRLPVVSALTCEVGRFELPGGVSLAEALVAHEGGGAAAVVSPSGLSLNSQAKVLNDRLFQSMFQDGERVIGEAFLRALEDYRDTEGSMRFMLDIYNCACDPATIMPPAP